jgi:hypothetical protein
MGIAWVSRSVPEGRRRVDHHDRGDQRRDTMPHTTTTHTLTIELDTSPAGVEHLARLIANAAEAQRAYRAALDTDDDWLQAATIRDRIAVELAGALGRNLAGVLERSSD